MEEKDDRPTLLISYKGVCRTAPATPGLLLTQEENKKKGQLDKKNTQFNPACLSGFSGGTERVHWSCTNREDGTAEQFNTSSVKCSAFEDNEIKYSAV